MRNDEQYIANLLQRQSSANTIVSNYISQLIIIRRQKNTQVQVLTEERITLEQEITIITTRLTTLRQQIIILEQKLGQSHTEEISQL